MIRWFKAQPMRAAAMATTVLAATFLLVALDNAQGSLPREILWDIVHSACVSGEMQSHDPRPCAEVDLDGGVDQGFAILKDLRGASQFLLIATAEIAGIESPTLESPSAPNYFADAWEARKYVDEALHKALPRDDVSLAINSAVSRSQDQLHIHIDCVREDVRAALLLHAADIGNTWKRLPFAFSRHHYMALWVPGENLGAVNPFKLVADGIPGAAQKMGDQTLVVMGATRADGTAGFIVLDDQADRTIGDPGAGEELQDHACRVAATVASSN
jgi:CDP-diacylglycerol pyrophosphatase